ncbi:MAG: dihydroorotase [Butyrivibrio sp.]|nr:dihydroorotase [Butyrivibrio sp.]
MGALLIRGGTLMDPASGIQAPRDILTEDGRIAQIALPGEIQPAAAGEILDAAGLVVAPGLVDTHVHFRDPGQTHKEDLTTGAEAAAQGGCTTVVLMGNTVPPMDDPVLVRDILNRGEQAPIRICTCANVTRGMQGETLTDMDALAEAGAVLFSDDGRPIVDGEVFRAACAEAVRLHRVISLHEEDPSCIVENGIDAGPVARQLKLTGSPREAEIRMVQRDIGIARETGAALTIQHISTAESVALIRQARAEGLSIHAEATPHHLTLTAEDVLQFGPLAKMNPPVRTAADRAAIRAGLMDGTIEIIATDHAPHTLAEKQLADGTGWDPVSQEAGERLRLAPSGITGLETSLALAVQALYHGADGTGMTLLQILACMTSQPAKIYGLEELYGVGRVTVNGPADLCIFAPGELWRFDHSVSRSANTPFLGCELPARIHYTICRGRIVYRKENQ